MRSTVEAEGAERSAYFVCTESWGVCGLSPCFKLCAKLGLSGIIADLTAVQQTSGTSSQQMRCIYPTAVRTNIRCNSWKTIAVIITWPTGSLHSLLPKQSSQVPFCILSQPTILVDPEAFLSLTVSTSKHAITRMIKIRLQAPPECADEV